MPDNIIANNMSSGSFSSLLWVGRETIEEEYKYINKHNYIPKNFNFNKIKNEEELFFGIELEIDEAGKNDDNAKLVIDVLGENNVYCKQDGSLRNGFEIVTHPCTYEYHRQLPYEELFKKLSKLGYKSHDVGTCGMHVHFNRNYFAKDKLTQDLCISKLLYLFEKFWEKVVTIARRDSNRYARRFYLNDEETILDMYAKSKNSDKYGVINLQHKDTCEIRIFKGTLNYNTFMATLQFVKTIVEVSKNIDIYKIQSVTWESLTNKFSNELNDYIEEREAIRNKEKLEKQEEMSSMIRTRIGNSYVMDYGIRNTNIGVLSSRVTTLDDLSNIISNSLTSFAEIEDIGINNMNITQVRSEISSINRQIRNSRNPLEQRRLQRELQIYNERLCQLRRQN